MDFLARSWLFVGARFGVRPVTVIGLFAGAVLFASGLTFAVAKSGSADAKVNEIRRVLCDGSAMADDPANRQRCRALLEQLLNDPTREQVERLRELIKEKP